jgi:hypothetical protein
VTIVRDPVVFLGATDVIDSDSKAVRSLADEIAGDAVDEPSKVRLLFDWVRDEIRYDTIVCATLELPYGTSVLPLRGGSPRSSAGRICRRRPGPVAVPGLLELSRLCGPRRGRRRWRSGWPGWSRTVPS